MSVNPVPEGYHTVTPYLMVHDVAALIDYLKDGFGAVEIGRHARPDGTIMHAQVRIGDSFVMMGEPQGGTDAMPAMLHLYVPDVDALYLRAVKAGGISLRAPADQFYGDRSGGVQDPAGNRWWISTHVEDVTPEEMERRMKAAGE